MGRARTEAALAAFHDEQRLGRTHDGQLLRWLWQWLRPHRALVWLAITASLVSALVTLGRPLVMRWAIDRGVIAGDSSTLTQGGILLLVLVVVEQVLVFTQTYSLQSAGARAVAELRGVVFAFLQRQRLAFFDHQPIGRLVTRVTNDTDAILELFASGLASSVGDVLRLFGIAAILLALDARLALTAFAAVVPAVLLVLLIRPWLRRAFRDVRARTARLNANMDEQVAGMTVVQAFRRQRAAEAEFDEVNAAYRDANVRAITFDAMQDAAIDMVLSVAIAAVVVRLGYQPVSVGTLVAYNLYLFLFFEPLSVLAQRYSLLQSAMAGAERVVALLEHQERDALPHAEPSPGTGLSAAAIPVATGDVVVEFAGVTFGYKPGSPVLEEVSFTVRKGEHVAIVGATGAGKSTVAALALRLYDVDQGMVRVAGRDVRYQERTALRRQFAVVPQDVFLFPGTLAENVALGRAPDLERVRAALARTGALDLLLRRPGGLDAPVGERGMNLSAGERQLIAFARALYRDAEVLLLDEATASVDSATEARLQRAIAALLEARTAIVIAHRLSTIRAADRILVLHQGRLVEQGTHGELVARGGVYARLHALQAVVERAPGSRPDASAGAE